MGNLHEANRRHWDETADKWQALEDRDGLWRRCVHHPDLAFDGGSLDLIRGCLGPLKGRDVCVIGSGDNCAAFALAGCGAKVTSVDISQRRLDIAAERAAVLGVEISFVRSDAATLAELGSGCFDLVVSTNGFFVWICDPRAVFNAVYRVLRPGGFYVFYDIHPFLRPWVVEDGALRMEKPYGQEGPLPRTDESEGYEFHWTLSGLLQPLIESGFLMRRIDEAPPRSQRFWTPVESRLDGSHEGTANKRQAPCPNPLAGLPAWLVICAQRS